MLLDNLSEQASNIFPPGFLRILEYLLMSYLLWRLWRFTLVPMIWRREPRLLLYWIPMIGHTWDFAWHSRSLIDRGSDYFGKDVPFTLAVAGKTTVILSNPHEVSAMWRSTTGLVFDPFVRDIWITSGISESALAKCWLHPRAIQENRSQKSQPLLLTDNPLNKCHIHLESEWFNSQLLSEEHLADLTRKYQRALKFGLSEDNFSIKPRDKEDTHVYTVPKMISVQRFTKYFSHRSSFVTFFGEKLLEMFLNIIEDYIEFEEESWKISYHVPGIFAKKMQRSKERVVAALEEYLALPAEETPDVSWLIRTANTEKQLLGLTSHEAAACQVMFIWAALSNVSKMCFWTFAHIIADPILLAAIRNETDKSRTPEGEVDIDILSTQCPLLESTWNEALRICDNTFAVRKAEKECTIGGISIHPGDTVMGPFHRFLQNQSIFGENTGSFDAGRFMRNRDLQHSKWYTPFGGGRTLCPGRKLAQREVFLFVAFAVSQFEFDLDLDGGRTTVPEIDEVMPSLAVMTPLTEMVVNIAEKA